MEFMSQYDCKIVYIKGDENTVADALLQTNFDSTVNGNVPGELDSEQGCKVLDRCDNTWLCAHLLANSVTLLISPPVVASTFSIGLDSEPLSNIKTGYSEDPLCKKILDANFLPHGIHKSGYLLYAGDRLIVPYVLNICELLFHLAHDILGHFGFTKTYGSL
jgi:hypothetical protein